MDQGRDFGAPPARGGRAHAACRPNSPTPRGERHRHILITDPPGTIRVLASDRRLAPSPWPLDCPATTTHVKSASRPYGIEQARHLTRAALTWVCSYQTSDVLKRSSCGLLITAARSANQHRICRSAHEERAADLVGESPATIEGDELWLADQFDAPHLCKLGVVHDGVH